MSQKRASSAGDRRREQLLELGLEIFGARSFDEISIDDIAAGAGISRGLLYHYFQSKRGFYVETVRHAAARLVDEVDTPRDLEPEARMRAGLGAYLDHVERHARAHEVLLRGGLGVDPEIAAIVEGTREAIIGRIIAEAPELEATPAIHAALRGWIHLVEGMSLDWVARRELGRARLVELLTAALWTIVGAAIVGEGDAPA
ncbi:MAG: TetR/AcrR family transcriptional regulator [Myxococcales bacterium]|nr:TetR/AcrR family transcriptional regulator [Myxococcales bacterium]MCB9701056.1 TetR/AcrR family transcriptional regulator [Myxococcales bacterium]